MNPKSLLASMAPSTVTFHEELFLKLNSIKEVSGDEYLRKVHKTSLFQESNLPVKIETATARKRDGAAPFAND